ncbi:endolysin [Ralstonia phage RS-PII-1]|uniref:Endolysin n=1 Tax=Ralstonia phage RS-PII-1 TaxID=1932892 RepID=A0A1L7DQK7_9CAUD|nr:endolysin [Ralstonia phage RS-PII-1]APU00292.1 lysozyme [Ralstonia phage RS-PII-1]
MQLPANVKRWLVAGALAIILPLTARFEGLRYKAYPDPALGWAVPTICYGHTKGVRQGDTATQAQCDAWLREDMTSAMNDVLRLVNVPISPDELAAYGDFVFNVGATKFASSTMLRKLNAGDHAGACAELSRWVYAGNEKLPGLVNRRAAVRAICEHRT